MNPIIFNLLIVLFIEFKWSSFKIMYIFPLAIDIMMKTVKNVFSKK